MLGEQLAASPEPWLARQLGVLAPHASLLLREDYAGSRARPAAAYREAAGITATWARAIAPGPHRGNPELDHLQGGSDPSAGNMRRNRRSARGMTQGELEARILDGDRALASAPPDVSRVLRLTALAEADAWEQTADAEILGTTRPASAGATGARPAHGRPARATQAANALYEEPRRRTGSRREAAGKARDEMSGAGSPSIWPDSRKPGRKMNHLPWWSGGISSNGPRRGPALAAPAQRRGRDTHAEEAAVIARPQHDGYRPEPNPNPEALTCAGGEYGSTRAAARARRPTGPPGRPADPRGRGRAPHRRRQRCAASPRAIHGPP